MASGSGEEDAATVVLVIDDAQYADEGLLDFLDHLLSHGEVRRLRDRTGPPRAAGPQTRPRRQADDRGPVGPPRRLQQWDALLDGLVERPAPGHPLRHSIERAEGIPLFAVETIRALIDRDAVIPKGGRYVPADGVEVDLDAIGAPASLQALIAARLDALTPAERRVVTDASVLGAAFTRHGLASLGSDDADLDAVLDSLVRKEIVALTTDRFSAEIGQYRFVQAMVRQVAYGTQSRRDRKQRHLAATEYLAGGARCGRPCSRDRAAPVGRNRRVRGNRSGPGGAGAPCM